MRINSNVALSKQTFLRSMFVLRKNRNNFISIRSDKQCSERRSRMPCSKVLQEFNDKAVVKVNSIFVEIVHTCRRKLSQVYNAWSIQFPFSGDAFDLTSCLTEPHIMLIWSHNPLEVSMLKQLSLFFTHLSRHYIVRECSSMFKLSQEQLVYNVVINLLAWRFWGFGRAQCVGSRSLQSTRCVKFALDKI